MNMEGLELLMGGGLGILWFPINIFLLWKIGKRTGLFGAIKAGLYSFIIIFSTFIFCLLLMAIKILDPKDFIINFIFIEITQPGFLIGCLFGVFDKWIYPKIFKERVKNGELKIIDNPIYQIIYQIKLLLSK